MGNEIVLSGDTIRILRILRGFSQRQLGLATGLKPWRVFKLENELCVPRVEEMNKIIEVLYHTIGGQ